MMSLSRRTRPISAALATAFTIALAALFIIALFPVFPNRTDIHVDDTASRTVRAPHDVSFVSEFLTEQRRDAVAAAVPPSLVYDGGVRTRQLNAYDAQTAEITQFRALPDDARKRNSLASLLLSPRSVDTAIALTPERWTAVATEGRRILAETLSVSLDDAAVAEAKDAVDAQISPDFFAGEALLTAELVRTFITTTLAVDNERTEEARAAARSAVAGEVVNVEEGDAILTADSRVDELAIEKLHAAGLLSRDVEWRNVVAVAIVSAIAAIAVAGYLLVVQPPGISSERHLMALAVVSALPLVGAKFFLPVVLPDDERQFLAFVLPVAAGPMLIAALLDSEIGVVVSAVTGLLIAFISAILPDVSLVASVGPLDTFRFMLVYGLGPIAGVYLVHGAERLSRYLTAGVAVAIVSYALLAATWFIDTDRQLEDLAWMGLTGINGAVSSVLAAGAFVTAGVIFGLTTRVQLMELAQLNAPLLRRLQDEAAGTFHHSVIVGNLAERAADLIGADPLLTRVGCYYHDIGKVLQPGMYIENQMGGGSPHDDLSPQESADVIRQHVRGGLDLARRARLPVRVQAFIPEHHGTRLVTYFYRKAAERDPDVDPAAFTYPGPRPQSRETAIVMLADSTEAVIRSSDDRSPAEIDRLVDEVIAERLAEGQLDDCDLTLRDLRTIAESFKSTMRAVYHPRVAYPQPAPMERRRVLRLPIRTLSDVASPAPRRRR